MTRGGQLIELTLIVIALFIIGFFIMFGNYFVTQFNNNVGADYSTEAKDFITNSEWAWSFADNIYPVIIVLVGLGAIVTFFYIPTHPVLIIVEFVMLGFVIMTGGIVSNVNANLFNSTEFNATATNFPIISLVNNNLGFFITVIGLIGMTALFMKRGEPD